MYFYRSLCKLFFDFDLKRVEYIVCYNFLCANLIFNFDLRGEGPTFIIIDLCAIFVFDFDLRRANDIVLLPLCFYKLLFWSMILNIHTLDFSIDLCAKFSF